MHAVVEAHEKYRSYSGDTYSISMKELLGVLLFDYFRLDFSVRKEAEQLSSEGLGL